MKPRVDRDQFLLNFGTDQLNVYKYLLNSLQVIKLNIDPKFIKSTKMFALDNQFYKRPLLISNGPKLAYNTNCQQMSRISSSIGLLYAHTQTQSRHMAAVSIAIRKMAIVCLCVCKRFSFSESQLCEPTTNWRKM